MKYVCSVCGWEYDEALGYPEGGIAPGTPWETLPQDFECPICGVPKDEFASASFSTSKSVDQQLCIRALPCTQLFALSAIYVSCRLKCKEFDLK